MKKLLLLLTLVGLASQPCIAGQGQAPFRREPEAFNTSSTAVSQSIQGVVDTVDHADPAQGVRPRITIIAFNGVKYVFDVRHTTTIYDRDWKSTTLERVQKGQQVKVKYSTTREGFKEALSIITIK